MRYASVCSGVEAASLAWEPLGWKPVWFAEIEPFPCAVLSHHWPTVPNYGDMTKLVGRILTGEIEAPDILIGGTPCQAFSVAGLRNSLDDERGQLTLTLVRLLNAIDFIRQQRGQTPCILIWENVPGVLNTKDNAFGCFLGAVSGADRALKPTGRKWTNAGAVFGEQRQIAWRILDAQYFGVPQRRRRVFVAASAGAISTAEILFERQSSTGDFNKSHPAQQDTTGGAASGSHWDCFDNPHPTLNQSNNAGGIGMSNQELFSQRAAGLVTCRMRGFGDYLEDDIAATVKSRDYKDATDLVINGRQDPVVSAIAQTIDCDHSGNTNIVAIAGNIIGRDAANGGNGLGADTSGVCYTLTTTDQHAVSYSGGVRRLMPIEAERLQGFPDNHTQIPWRGKPAEQCPDGLRYKAIGNSMAVPVIRWIGQRINNLNRLAAEAV